MDRKCNQILRQLFFATKMSSSTTSCPWPPKSCSLQLFTFDKCYQLIHQKSNRHHKYAIEFCHHHPSLVATNDSINADSHQRPTECSGSSNFRNDRISACANNTVAMHQLSIVISKLPMATQIIDNKTENKKQKKQSSCCPLGWPIFVVMAI